MVHPTELLRTDSNGQRSFSAPLESNKNNIDCGLSALSCLNRVLNLERYAKPGIFVLVLSILGFINGSVLSYFRGTSHLWSRHYNLSQDTTEWFIYTNEVFVGLFALVVAYWGNRIHRATWLGALAIYLAVASATLAVPEIYNPFSQNETSIEVVTGTVLCQVTQSVKIMDNIRNNEFQIVAFAVLLVYQILYALATISVISHGITYVDDNMSPRESPGYIGLALAATEIGKHVGIYLAWMPHIFKAQSVFTSPVWLIFAVNLFACGCIIAMFPKIMPNVLMKKSVTSLLSLASGNAITEVEQPVDGFFKSLWRVLRNKILAINIMSLILMQSALINFSILEKFFNQSKYHVETYNDSSGYTDATFIQFTTNLLRQPLVAISVVTSGMIIAKMKPSAKCLVTWNITVFILIAIFFASTRFWNCANKFKNELRNQLIIPYCSWSCGCSLDGPFQPVCLNGETYFSPCIAGCTVFDSALKVYQNCSCGYSDKIIATQGSCDAENCSTLLAFAQVNSVISSGLLATTMVSNLIINMRCVLSNDKALALGLELTFLGFIPYLPIRAIYDVIADNYCQIYGKKSCQFYSEYFGLFLASATVILMVLAAIFAIVLLFLIGNLNLYNNNQSPQSSHSQINLQYSTHNDDTVVGYNENIEPAAEDFRQHLEESTALVHNNDVANLRRQQRSEGELNTPNRLSKKDRINMYLSEGDLVKSLNKSNSKNSNNSEVKSLNKSNSKNSNNSGISTDSSLNAIANNVGDDHDSDTFSGHPTLTRPKHDQLETSF